MSSNLQPVDRVTPERRDELLKKIVDVIDRYGLYAPAAFFITLSKPVAFLGSQAMFMAAPIAGVLIKEELIEDYAQLMSDRENVEYLLNMLEERELEGRKKQQEQKKAKDPNQKGPIDWFKSIFRRS